MFIRGRSISDGIRTIDDTLECAKRNTGPRILEAIDLIPVIELSCQRFAKVWKVLYATDPDLLFNYIAAYKHWFRR